MYCMRLGGKVTRGDMLGVVNTYFVCSLIVCQNQRLIRSLCLKEWAGSVLAWIISQTLLPKDQ